MSAQILKRIAYFADKAIEIKMEIKTEVFGKYILLDKIAAGGMAEIYLAKAPGAENVSKFLAIKRILPQYSNNHEFIEMFKEEAKIAIHLAHANVVSIIEFGEQSGLFYLAMQYVDGKNLRQSLNRFKKEKKYFTLPQVVHIIKESAKGLDHAHRCVDGTSGTPLNITHRDISPQNIMISYDGEVRIIDFGIAKAESKIESTRAGTLKGKFGYMSPEQAEGYEVDFRTDIFSLGIVLWELLAQDRLFVSNNEINTLKKIRECHVPSLRKLDPNIPQELERITNKALARDRTLRYQSAEELAQDLQVFLNKHYPEFTSRDLSQNLKTIFNDERDESRKKMMEYAKVTLPPMDEKTEYVSDKTNTITETDASGSRSFANANSPPAEERNDGAPQNLTSSKKLALNFETNNIDNFNLEFDRVGLVHAKKARPRVGAGTNSKISNTHSAYSTLSSHTNPLVLRRKRAQYTKYATYALVLLAIGGYFFYNPNQYQQAISFSHGLIDNETTVSSESDKSQNPEKSAAAETKLTPEAPFFNLLVTSIPSGAEISVDDKQTGVFTPGQVRVPINKAYNLKLDMEGFLSETKSLITIKQGDELRVTLKKKETAYINVTVAGGEAAIYVNGKKISDKTTVVKYPINANTSIKVQAYNPVQKKYAEKFVEVPAGEVMPIILNLLEQRAPTNKK
jgi:serine/threonine protein kinase